MTHQIRVHIREAYQKELPTILKYQGRSCPYFIDWSNIMSPIEKAFWSDIRYLGLRLFPQFPVKHYFIDFADPINKIGVELDGKEWHKNQEKNAIRQRELEKLGWKIYRISGRDAYYENEFGCSNLAITLHDLYYHNGRGRYCDIKKDNYNDED